VREWGAEKEHLLGSSHAGNAVKRRPIVECDLPTVGRIIGWLWQ